MSELKNKIDFAVVISVNHANPNGDPLDGNRPRTTFDGRGEISDVCLKRKIRNRLMDEGHPILVQSDNNRIDEFRSIKDRVDSIAELKELSKKKDKDKDNDAYACCACNTWIDVRAFGQVFAFGKGDDSSDATSVGVRGPVTVQSAFSINPVDVSSLQITKTVNLITEKDPNKKSSDTMGTKHRVDKGIYVTFGSINVQLAQKTGFSDDDAEAIKDALRTLFRNDASAARPDGSMEVLKVIWWKHSCKNGQYSAAKVHRSLHVTNDGEITVDKLESLDFEIIDGE